MGDAISTTDGLFPASSPFIVWEPTAKQLILSSQSVYPIGNESQVSQTHRAVFTNSQHGRGQWRWSPAPWNVRAGYPTCNSNYSPNLVVRSNGKVRLIAPASEWSTTKCSERTGEAFIGGLFYQSDFAVDGQSGWINFGGDWSISGCEYVFAPVGDQNAIAVTGSTGWTQYTITSDVMVTTPSGRVGLMTHVAAPLLDPIYCKGLLSPSAPGPPWQDDNHAGCRQIPSREYWVPIQHPGQWNRTNGIA
jgi:hypothetical protein